MIKIKVEGAEVWCIQHNCTVFLASAEYYISEDESLGEMIPSTFTCSCNLSSNCSDTWVIRNPFSEG